MERDFADADGRTTTATITKEKGRRINETSISKCSKIKIGKGELEK